MKRKRINRVISAVLALTMVVSLGLSSAGSVNAESNSDSDDGKYTVTLADAKNGKIEFSDESDGRFAEGEKVNLKLKADDGYIPSGIGISETDSGEEVVSMDTSDDLYSFTMPAQDLTVSANFAKDKSLSLQAEEADWFKDADTDDYLYDPLIETYIKDNINSDYINYDGSTFYLVNLMTVKQSLFDKALVDDDDTIDSIMGNMENEFDEDEFNKFIVMFTNFNIPVYELDKNSDYVVAYANTMQGDENASVREVQFARCNNNAEMVDGCIYDYDTGLVYIPRDLMVDSDDLGYYIDFVQAQFMQIYDMGGSELGDEDYYDVDVEVDSLSEDKDDELTGYTTVASLIDTETTVKVDAGLDEDRLVVTVNGAPIEKDQYSYNSNLGYITVEESPAVVQSVVVAEEDATLGEKISAVIDSISDILEVRAADSVSDMVTGGDPVSLSSADGIKTGTYLRGEMYYKYSGTSLASGEYKAYGYISRDGEGKLDWSNLYKAILSDPSVFNIGNAVYNSAFGYYMDVSWSDTRLKINGTGDYAQTDFSPWGLSALICAHISTEAGSDSNDGNWEYENCGIRFFEVNEEEGYALIGMYTAKTHSQTGMGVLKLAIAPSTGYMTLEKSSDNTTITDGNSCYNIAGAEYTVYTDSACTTVAKDANGNNAVLTTKSDGTTNTIEIEQGTYYVQETGRPDGYKLNSDPVKVDVTSDNDEDNPALIEVTDPPMNDPFEITIQKIDADSGKAEPQGDARLDNAEFTVNFYAGYYDAGSLPSAPTRTWVFDTVKDGDVYKAGPKVSGSLVSDKSDSYYTYDGDNVFPLGTYTITETGEPVGYLLQGTFTDANGEVVKAGTAYYNQLKDDGSTTGYPVWLKSNEYDLTYTASDQVIRGGVEVQKRDAQSLRDEPQGSGSFEGITYEIVSNCDYDVLVDGTWYHTGDTVKKLVTDENGYAVTDSSTLPYGHYTVNEVVYGKSNTHETSNDSYLYGDDGHEDAIVDKTIVTSIPFFIEEEGKIVNLTGDDDSILEADEAMNDVAIRGDIAIRKHESTTNESLSVPFKVTSMTTGESHIFWTDSNGDYSTDSTWIPHTYKTNEGEDYTDGFWFYGYEDWEDCGVEVDDTLGALPIDDYYLDELRCEANEGLELVHTTFHVYQDERVVDLGTIENYPIDINLGTTLTNDWTGEHQATIFENHDISLTDVVSYEGLDVGEEYTMRGVLMDKETGEAVIDADGNEVTDSVTFIPEESDGEVEVTFIFNAYGMHDTYVVAFEYLYDVDGNCIGSHEDIDDEGQTVQLLVPTVWTYASETETGLKSIEPKDEVEITDYLDITDLIIGHTYYVYGRAVNKDTGELILDHNGDPLELYIEFVADAEEMYLDIMNFHFNASELAGTEVVFEEYIYADPDREILICEEEDLGSAEQTVYFLGDIQLGTTLVDDETEDHFAMADEHVILTDTVEYDGAKVGETYTVTGTLMDQETGLAVTDKDGNEITSESEPFVAEEEHGFIEVTFEFDASDLAGDSVVAYEFMYNSEGTLVSAHEDINDEGQTVGFPEIGTTLVYKESGTHEATADSEVTLVDTVEYDGLTVGETYTISGTLMDKETGEAFVDADGNEVTGYAEFTAEDTSGTTTVEFTFNAAGMNGKSVVAFEQLYDANGNLIATHEDIDDEAQTVDLVYEENEETPNTTTTTTTTSGNGPKTGDYSGLLFWIVLGILAIGVCAAGIVAYRKRKKV